MNQHTIIGNLTRDPETGTTPGGINYCQFTVAVRKKYRREGGPDADFIRVTAWRGLGDTCAKYLSKGRKVAVVGVPSASAWIGQDGKAKAQLELTADDVEFCGSGNGGGSAGPTDDDAPPAPAATVDPESGMIQVEDPEEQPF